MQYAYFLITISYCLGVTITPVDETKFTIFAPNQYALKEAEEMIKILLDQPVRNF